MFVIIVGGGKIGAHLAGSLLADGYEVKVVEPRESVLAKLHRDLPTEAIFAGDGTLPADLVEAGIQRAQVLAAVTGDDEVNLAVALMARNLFGVRRIIAKVNNPKNQWLFTPDNGVDVALSQATLMARLIEEEMSLGDMVTLLSLHQGNFSIVEEKIEHGAPADGRPVRELDIPRQCTLIAVIRKGDVLNVHGDSVLQAGDEVLALAKNSEKKRLSQLFEVD